jgi:hypothetical protein
MSVHGSLLRRWVWYLHVLEEEPPPLCMVDGFDVCQGHSNSDILGDDEHIDQIHYRSLQSITCMVITYEPDTM